MSWPFSKLWTSRRCNTNSVLNHVKYYLLVLHPCSSKHGVGTSAVVLESYAPPRTALLIKVGVRTPFRTDPTKVYSKHREMPKVRYSPALA